MSTLLSEVHRAYYLAGSPAYAATLAFFVPGLPVLLLRPILGPRPRLLLLTGMAVALPLLIGVVGYFLSLSKAEEALRVAHLPPKAILAQARVEALNNIYIGGALSAVLGLLAGLAGAASVWLHRAPERALSASDLDG